MSSDRTARARIRQYLATHGPVVDPSGYATGVLKDAIGYTGSSVAFIQLVTAMSKDQELSRSIRGKRTYRISLADGHAAEALRRWLDEVRPAALAALRRLAAAG